MKREQKQKLIDIAIQEYLDLPERINLFREKI